MVSKQPQETSWQTRDAGAGRVGKGGGCRCADAGTGSMHVCMLRFIMIILFSESHS